METLKKACRKRLTVENVKCVTSLNDVTETLYLLKLFEFYNRNRALALYIFSEGNTHEHFGIMDEEPILPNSDGQILRFPVKLRKIIDTCQTDAIGWNQEGTVVRINKTVFETEYLSKAHRPFQTTSFSSFIRQLNFYGFQKVNQRASLKVSEDSDPVFFDYRHPHFKRNSADLSLVQRKNKSRRPQNFEDAFARIIEPSSKVYLSLSLSLIL